MRIRTVPCAAGLVAALAFGLAACTSTTTTPGMGTVSVRLTDAPGDFEAVHIVIREVAIHRGDVADSLSGWETIKADSTTYDLLTLQNGVFAALGQATLPAGHYTQVRLVLGAGSTVTVDGITSPLQIPSGMQTGIKLVGSFDVPENGVLDLALDFDAQRSIVRQGNGVFRLKPTIRVTPFSTAGSIAGRVLPAQSASVSALVGADTVQTTVADSSGAFTLAALAAGSYTVAVHPANAAFRDSTITGVAVTAQQTTQLGAIELRVQ